MPGPDLKSALLDKLRRAVGWSNTPLVDVPAIDEQFDPETGTMQPAPLGGAGGPLVSAMTTPQVVGTTLATGGAGAATALGRQTLARMLATIPALANAGQAFEGGRTLAQGIQAGDPLASAGGAAQLLLGGAGARSAGRTLLAPRGALPGAAVAGDTLFDDATLGKIAQQTNNPEIGGASFKAGNVDLAGRPVTAVAAFPETSMIIPPTRDVTVEDLKAFLRDSQNNRLLQQPGTHLGGWRVGPKSATKSLPEGTKVMDVGGHPLNRAPRGGITRLGLTDTPPEQTRAMQLARDFGQRSIFDLDSFTEYPNPAYIDPQPKSFPQEFTRRLPRLLEPGARAGVVGRGAITAGAPEALRQWLLQVLRQKASQQ